MFGRGRRKSCLCLLDRKRKGCYTGYVMHVTNEEDFMQPKCNFRVLILTVLFSLLCLGGCGKNDERMDQIKSLGREQTEEMREAEELSIPGTEEMPEQKKTKAEQLKREQAFSRILEYCTKEFIGYHVLDCTFLRWLSFEYGDECIEKIADAVEAGNQDPDIWYELTGNTIHVLWLLYCERTGFQHYQLENVKWQSCASSGKTTFAFTGDINFSEGYSTTRHLDSCANGIYDCFSDDLLARMNEADVMMINNEFTYSTRGEALQGKAYTFRADPKRAGLLNVFGTDIVNLANNHVYDFGPDALLDTIDTLDKEEIPHVGAGANIEEASKPYYFVCNGRKIAIVAATQIERSLNYTKEATETEPGVLKTLSPDKFVKVIQSAKKNSDIVIAVVHWGTEGDSNYGRDQQNLAKEFVKAGADAIIGGHTHCLQGFEIMDGVPVIYSLGNFWFSSSTLDTGLAEITIDENGELALGFVPCIQKNFRTSLVTEESEKQRIFDFMQRHSASGVVIGEDGILRQEN